MGYYLILKTSMEDFSNKPCLNLSGKTWDAQHMDKFLNSDWGTKLYKSPQRTQEPSPIPQNSSSVYAKSLIRPSASFMSEYRERPTVEILEKSRGSALDNFKPTSLSKTPQKSSPGEITKKMRELDEQNRRDYEEYIKLISPKKRKQLFEAEKQRKKVYSELKNEKLLDVKRQRIVAYAYPQGILGVDHPDRGDFSPLYNKLQKENEKKQQIDHENRMNRAKYIMNHTAANAHIQFFNDKNTEVISDKPVGPKRVEEVPIHYHNTQETLFTPEAYFKNPDRAIRLQDLSRGNRTFNIISGAEYND